ncbi:hypothetical protein RHGRI_016462 [Rhododendron griersonianum]|uniref:Uncharacterized protein n=1 Tax=Rhododendron griersonianum TaxID=479676 RepID=A0AAV6JU76_9ERIC|nr:hypothetical protein RHGRI_016462 [Rhododendron griersonianum]
MAGIQSNNIKLIERSTIRKENDRRVEVEGLRRQVRHLSESLKDHEPYGSGNSHCDSREEIMCPFTDKESAMPPTSPIRSNCELKEAEG